MSKDAFNAARSKAYTDDQKKTTSATPSVGAKGKEIRSQHMEDHKLASILDPDGNFLCCAHDGCKVTWADRELFLPLTLKDDEKDRKQVEYTGTVPYFTVGRALYCGEHLLAKSSDGGLQLSIVPDTDKKQRADFHAWAASKLVYGPGPVSLVSPLREAMLYGRTAQKLTGALLNMSEAATTRNLSLLLLCINDIRIIAIRTRDSCTPDKPDAQVAAITTCQEILLTGNVDKYSTHFLAGESTMPVTAQVGGILSCLLVDENSIAAIVPDINLMSILAAAAAIDFEGAPSLDPTEALSQAFVRRALIRGAKRCAKLSPKSLLQGLDLTEAKDVTAAMERIKTHVLTTYEGTFFSAFKTHLLLWKIYHHMQQHRTPLVPTKNMLAYMRAQVDALRPIKDLTTLMQFAFPLLQLNTWNVANMLAEIILNTTVDGAKVELRAFYDKQARAQGRQEAYDPECKTHFLSHLLRRFVEEQRAEKESHARMTARMVEQSAKQGDAKMPPKSFDDTVREEIKAVSPHQCTSEAKAAIRRVVLVFLEHYPDYAPVKGQGLVGYCKVTVYNRWIARVIRQYERGVRAQLGSSTGHERKAAAADDADSGELIAYFSDEVVQQLVMAAHMAAHECPVCFLELEDGKAAAGTAAGASAVDAHATSTDTTLRGKHYFCKPCLGLLMGADDALCPLCRGPFQPQ